MAWMTGYYNFKLNSVKINVNWYENTFIFYIFHLVLYLAVKSFYENFGLVLRRSEKMQAHS